MPLPTPGTDETRDDFLSRCAGDEKVAAEFPDGDQRLAVCGNLYDKAGDMERLAFSIAAGQMPNERLVAHFRLAKDAGHSWDAEVFAVGTWNGYEFKEADLEKMVESFKALNGGGFLEVPLKFGHNDEQPMTDGTPALGWVTDLYLKKDDKGRSKLMAKLDNVPEVVHSAVKAGRYRKVSIELEFDVKHKGTQYPYVMTGIALLGADLPAVNTLADLTAYMGRGDSLVASRSASFSAVSGKLETKEPKMAEIDDKELEQLRAQAAKAETLEAEKAEFERKQAAQAVETSRKAVNDQLDAAVKDMRITPAQRVGFAKALRVDDDGAVVGITAETVEAMLPEKAADPDKGSAFGRQSAQDREIDTDDKLDQAARKIQAESGGKLNYSRALELAMQADQETARAHVGVGA